MQHRGDGAKRFLFSAPPPQGARYTGSVGAGGASVRLGATLPNLRTISTSPLASVTAINSRKGRGDKLRVGEEPGAAQSIDVDFFFYGLAARCEGEELVSSHAKGVCSAET